MAYMYCPNCKTNTITERDHFSLLLAFLLAFTGLGLVIYILYHLDKKKDRCIHCGVKCLPKQLDNKDQIKEQLTDKQQEIQKENIPVEIIIGDKALFCHLCGEAINDRTLTYCPNCRSKI